MFRWTRLLTIIALAALTATATISTTTFAAARGDATREETIDGVLHVLNPATPPNGGRTLQLTESWRRGGEDDDLLFGLITQVRPDEEGNVYVLVS